MSNQELEMYKQWARDRLISFSSYTQENYDPQPFHFNIAKHLEEVFKGNIDNLIINIPPQRGKSQLASINFPAWCMGKDNTMRFMLCAYNSTLASHFSRNSLAKSKTAEYQSLFWALDLTVEMWQHRQTKEWGYYHATGVGWSNTWFGMDIGIIDDPFKDREEAESNLIRDKVWDRYTWVFYTRTGMKKARKIVIQTRWHIDDLTWRILQQEKEWWEKRVKLVVPAFNSQWESERNKAFPLWRLDTIKNTLGVRDFWALYMQDPIISTGSIFKPSDFRYFLQSDFERVDGMRKTDLQMALFIDPAFSTSKTSDDAVIVVAWRHMIRNELYIFDIYANTSAPSKTIDSMFNLAEKWELSWYPINFISCETVTINKDQSQFLITLKQEMNIRNKYYSIYEFKPQGKKEDRIKFQLEPLISNAKCFFIKWQGDYSAFRKLEEQLTLFPNAKHDDIIDCIAQSKQVFTERGKTAGKKEHRQRQYFDTITGKLVTV